MKRLLSLLLCLLMVMSLTVTAFADDNVAEEPEAIPEPTFEGVTLTIKGKTAGHTYNVYQIFKGNADKISSKDVISDIYWGDTMKTPIPGDDSGQLPLHTALLEDLQDDNVPIGNPDNPAQSTTMATEFASATDDPVSFAKAMGEWGDGKSRIDYFAWYLWINYITEYGIEPVKTVTKYTKVSDNVFDYTVTVPSGYYLIMDAAASLNEEEHDAYTKILVSLTSNLTVDVKSSVPSVTKGVADTLTGNYGSHISNQINRPHYYEWVGTIASDIDLFSFYQYEFHDTMSEGLTFGAIEQIFIKTSDGIDWIYNPQMDDYKDLAAQKEAWKMEVTVPVINPDNPESKYGGNISVSFADLEDVYESLVRTDEVHVIYSATLNERAVIAKTGTNNEVELKYSNNPYDEEDRGTTPPSDARVFTFDMEINKVDADSGSPVANAEFVLYHNHTSGNSKTPMYAVVKTEEEEPEGGDGETATYNTVSEGTIIEWTNDVKKATRFISDADGKIKIYGLKQDVAYRLTETEAPAGYNKLFGDTVVQITGYTAEKNAADELEITSITYEVDAGAPVTKNGSTAKVELDVKNKSGNRLPSTGGMGTTILYTVGGILVLAAIVLLVTKKRMTNSD